MHLYETLKKKNVKIREIPKWAPYLRKKWEVHFASHLSSEEKESIHFYDDKDHACGFMWHFFSYEKTRYLEKEAANAAQRLP
ncbi:DUF4275 family protein [Robertmurraya sp. P23]|uniref:DUF4275 family protein n=1 Tax=Robertmurraya sp. P23 TaxID=3436931 RepID=UPI003D99ADF8